ncbi:hypothetical protein TcCL_NonESM12451, partial [Trypanosoma cruzi]
VVPGSITRIVGGSQQCFPHRIFDAGAGLMAATSARASRVLPGTLQHHEVWRHALACRQHCHPYCVSAKRRCGRESPPLSAGVTVKRCGSHSGKTLGAERDVV